MENNEIPPYDIPLNDNNGMNMEPTVGGDIYNNAPLSSDAPLPGDESLVDFNFDDNIPPQDGQPQADGQPQSNQAQADYPQEMDGTAFESAASQPPKKGGMSVLALLLLVFFLIIVLIGALLFVYADSLNIPFLSKKDTQKVETMKLNDDMSGSLDSLPSEENDSFAEEGNEDTGVEITRERNLSEEDTTGLDNREQRPGGENYPSLQEPGSNPQDNQIARANYYSNGPVGRLDPFNPRNSSNNDLFEIIVPPVDPSPDLETQALMSLRISGIMYTPDSPSAIINIAGQDQLVRRGDKFDGFSVERITKDKVTVKAGINVYTASVGEILNIEQVGVNSIPNLNKKFAGPYSKGKDKIIEINMID